ncbi:hypothetical protein L593_09220 [Salinarchaeum sp. Harcht-Bsk1]|uniref:ArnT family glycosyltransferase n=1 Tax=Salinarchaeum sp. Harcht-Bsk1 TaxID=1333523 RepID=UPI0003423DDD|nr:glycosyltransferase family 39 protein [Salinarchaeum sp. Harcht-Bsk1]AGN01789.1 hypothetical protein L593_09220 [Salinarchaeum sp. Harcht-Bsk1]
MSSDRARSLLARLRSDVHARLRLREQPPERLAAALLALAAGALTFWIATDLFPYHSANHDEGVYLQQAALFLDGRLSLQAGPVADAVRPWFFVQDGGRLYPKYQPYPALLYAIPMGLFGAPRLALAFVAAANVALVYALGAQAFDRRIGLLAAAAFATTPTTLLTTSVFLPYAPTTMLNLAFAVCYLRAYRRRSVAWGIVAGLAIGLAFFGRPYTALLFAAPFVTHACWQIATSLRAADRTALLRGTTVRERWHTLPEALRRNTGTAAVGLAFVGLTLAYNVVLTGSPFRFPFTAFAPQDGPGFGHREIVGHGIDFTVALGIESSAHVLWGLATRWGPAGPVGTLLAIGGLAMAARRWEMERFRRLADRQPFEHTGQQLLAGLFVTVIAGNVAFWGNHNILADFDDPTDGLLGLFGPFYHFDLVAPLSIFAAAGLVGAWRWVRAWDPDPSASAGFGGRTAATGLAARLTAIASPRALRAVALASLLLLAAVGGAASAALVQGPVDRHEQRTDSLESAYEPFEERSFDDAVVFVPTPWGDWLNHPFQPLRNDGRLDGEVVYAMDRHTASDFAVLEAFPERTPYRYTYRGEWTPGDEPVEPRIQRLDVRTAESFTGQMVVGVPARIDHAAVRLETDGDAFATYRVDEPDDSIAVGWSLGAGGARLERPDGTAGEQLPIEAYDEVALQVRLVAADGSTLTYRQEVDVRRSGTSVSVIWPPERTVCTLVDDCGLEGTYLPEDPDAHGPGVSFETRLPD